VYKDREDPFEPEKYQEDRAREEDDEDDIDRNIEERFDKF
jgi:hypothetical protein